MLHLGSIRKYVGALVLLALILALPGQAFAQTHQCGSNYFSVSANSDINHTQIQKADCDQKSSYNQIGHFCHCAMHCGGAQLPATQISYEWHPLVNKQVLTPKYSELSLSIEGARFERPPRA